MIRQILSRIFQYTFVAMLSISLFFVLFIGYNSVDAIEEFPTTEENGNNSLKIVFDSSINKQLADNDNDTLESPMEEENISNYPDLGDDQVFPFVAGLDSYE